MSTGVNTAAMLAAMMQSPQGRTMPTPDPQQAGPVSSPQQAPQQQGPMQDQPPASAAEPSDFIYRVYQDEDGKKVTVYSKDGVRRPADDFDNAIDYYAEKGKDPKGFLVLKEGVADALRQGFEKVNQPIQQALPAAGKAIGQALGQNTLGPITNALQRYGIISPQTAQSIPQTTSNIGQGLGQAVASTVATPERAGMAAGTIAGSLATGGMSLLPQMLGAGVGGMAGSALGGAVTGTPPLPGNMLVAGSMAAAGQGITGVLKLALGMGTSQRAQTQVAQKLVDLMKSQYGGQANTSVIDGIASSVSGVEKLSRIGLDAIMQDFNTTFNGLKSDIMQVMPRTLSKGAQNTLRAQVGKITDAGRNMLEAMSDPKALSTAQNSFNNAVISLRQSISNDFSSMSQPVVKNAMDNADIIIQKYWQSLDRFKPGAAMFHALKDSGADNGFTAQAFQQSMMKYAQPPGSMMEQAGDIGRRGAVSGMDKPAMGITIPLGKVLGLPTPLNNLSFGKTLGTKYIGDISGTAPGSTAVGTAAATEALRSFLDTSSRRNR